MKIHILGASGSGVTTLGKALAAKIEAPYYDSDDFFWEKSDPPFTVRRNPDVRNAVIRSKLSVGNHWVLGGSAINWGEDVFPVFDLIIFLWIPSQIRMARLRQREFQRYGDVIFTDPVRKKLFEEFMAWANDYDNDTGLASRTRKAHEDWLAKMTSPVLRLSGDLTVTERLAAVLNKMEELRLTDKGLV